MRDKQKERHNAELRRLERKSWRQVSAVILFIIAGICSALAFPSSTWSEVHTLHSARSVQQHAQPARPRSREQVVTQIDALLTQMASNQQFSGSVLVAQGGNILLAKG